MIIEVYRGAGERRCQPVTEPLLADNVLIHRGRAEMDAHAHALNRVTLSLVFRPGMRLGQLVEMPSPVSASPQRGKVVGMQMVIEATDIRQVVDVEVPL